VRISVVANFATTASDGKNYQVDYYNLDAEREIPTKMEDWAKHLDGILTSTGERVVTVSCSLGNEKIREKATNCS